MKKIHPLVTAYIVIVFAVIVYSKYAGIYDLMTIMDYFMGLVFLSFGVLKVLDIKEFAVMYEKYDIIAKKIPSYGYVYPFIEILIGIWFILSGNGFILDFAALIILLVNLLSLYKVFLKKETQMCVCLGAKCFFPFGRILLFENIFMILMVFYMLFSLYSMSFDVSGAHSMH